MKGKETLVFESRPQIISTGSVVGQKESAGPLGECFDECIADGHYGEKSWERAESRFQNSALNHALKKANMKKEELGAIFSGDLLNQCVASSFAWKDKEIPFVGLYGACSTFVEGLCLGAVFFDSGKLESIAVCASSHFCTAERQYRNPLAYGGQRTPTSQRTVTGAGAAIIGRKAVKVPRICAATIGAVVDSGIYDANNMGAAMAPAAFDTLSKHFANTKTSPTDYDMIATGDLGNIGKSILSELFSREGLYLGARYIDCGSEMFDTKRQDMHAGASGCGCVATVFSAYISKELCEGRLRRILLAGTGSLQSPLTVQQKETIPGVCHVVEIRAED